MFRAVKDRCYVDFGRLEVPTSIPETKEILLGKGFEMTDVNVEIEAKPHIGKALFRLGARMEEAPHTFDCSTFTKWLYGRKGIWLPRFACQQFEAGTAVALGELKAGDLIFTSGYYLRAWHIGHVSLFTGSSVITAMIMGQKNGIYEISLENLLQRRKLRGIRRIVPHPEHGTTVIVPPSYDIETSDDIKYLVLSSIT